MKNKLKLDLVIIFLFLIFVFFLIFLYFNYIKNDFLEKREIYTKVTVGEKYAFDINATALTFGRIIPGKSSVSREIILINNYNQNILVDIFLEGKIKDFLKISRNNFVLKPNESTKVNFVASVPINSEYGIYDGKVIVLIKKYYHKNEKY